MDSRVASTLGETGQGPGGSDKQEAGRLKPQGSELGWEELG